MVRLRTIVAVAVVSCLAGSGLRAAPDPVLSEHLFDDANAAFLGGDLPRATAAYQALIEEGFASVELETNLGAVLFRQNKRGEAALHFERALYLDPADDDARNDLLELRRSNVDKLEGESDEGNSDTLFRIFSPTAGGIAAILLVISWALACLLFALRFLSPALREKKLVSSGAWIALVIAMLSGGIAWASAAAHKVALQRAILVAQSTPAREGPQQKAASNFEVHEGTLVRVEDEQSGFSRIRLQNGLTGWVPSETVARIVTRRWGGL
jgi:tetratricopeptide (TPR) repeat protein